jgi:hypothetical protein
VRNLVPAARAVFLTALLSAPGGCSPGAGAPPGSADAAKDGESTADAGGLTADAAVPAGVARYVGSWRYERGEFALVCGGERRPEPASGQFRVAWDGRAGVVMHAHGCALSLEVNGSTAAAHAPLPCAFTIGDAVWMMGVQAYMSLDGAGSDIWIVANGERPGQPQPQPQPRESCLYVVDATASRVSQATD